MPSLHRIKLDGDDECRRDDSGWEENVTIHDPGFEILPSAAAQMRKEEQADRVVFPDGKIHLHPGSFSQLNEKYIG